MTVTTPAGFRAAGVAAGLKSNGAFDVALVVNDGPSDAVAGVFTTNRFPAAPVLWSRQVVSDGRLRAVVLNSGGANACTGPLGFGDTHATAEHVARLLAVGAGDVAVCSTGLIGVRLPLGPLLVGVDKAVADLSPSGGSAAADAIRTTDTVPKQASRSGDGVTVGGMAKGAGMLAPSLATMLAVLTTDAVVDAAVADSILREAVGTTFQRVDSDGCLSTNDTVLLMASGASGVRPSEQGLARLVGQVCADLCEQLIEDAEGATKTVAIEVSGAAAESEAVEVGRAVARSSLLKCALFGNDANWGRVLAAIGTTSAAFEPHEVDVTMNGITVCRGGTTGDDRALVDLSGRRVHIVVDLHAGNTSATVWTNDLSHAYVHENSAYAT